MRTSQSQYAMMVDFMEKHGDLSKPSGGPRGRHFIQEKWKNLTEILNSDGSGDSRTEEKWRKVWSDWKNNIKKKMSRIVRHAGGTGGGPALQISLTDIENRVMQIIGVQAAVGMPVEEAGFLEDTDRVPQEDASHDNTATQAINSVVSEWTLPETSSQEDIPGTSEEAPLHEEHWQPPQKKKKPAIDAAKLFVESDNRARELEKERLRQRDEELRLRGEELRLREEEMRERVRQRDVELRLQEQWLEFMKEAMNVFVRYMERRNRNEE